MQGHCYGCHIKKNRNGAHTEIDHKRGKICLFPKNSWCWRPTKMKYLERRPYHTRQRAKLHKKLNEELKYNVQKAITIPCKKFMHTTYTYQLILK